MDQSKIIKIRNLIEELETIRGRHTALVSIYLPAGQNISTIVRQVEAEKSTAMNIKSKNNRKNVLDALERISRQLKLYKFTPENGLVIFSGNISEDEGNPDIELWAVEPPKPLNVKLYRCDQTFILDPLKEMITETRPYGLIVIDRKEATFGVLDGSSVKVLKKLTSGVPGKVRAGGQSAQRFYRLTEGMAKEFYRRAADVAKQLFFDMKNLQGILIGGPGPTKEDFLETGNLTTALKDKIKAIKDIGYADEEGLKNLVTECQDVLSGEIIAEEKKIMNEFLSSLAKQPEMVVYGEQETKKALSLGALKILLLTNDIKKKQLEELEELAINTDAKVVFISQDTEEGIQFKNLSGIGGILRFAVSE
ncbi:peptide chain release factor 1 [Candidatus Pacearchaeota archaeon CG_4_10_14_0_2_um_filter_31_10]|nr:MAG: peptide chain release factor 1 [Candidatus Pacearchaeota archaeon CG10_big_fil_rev_8_21_14_0_10_31_59]PIZ80041.1 MAG: peptide chain release factor 1 [Candidatus Pacearchaeota archaeon CG_4_10_14_0_2_um_filter_31_10]